MWTLLTADLKIWAYHRPSEKWEGQEKAKKITEREKEKDTMFILLVWSLFSWENYSMKAFYILVKEEEIALAFGKNICKNMKM